MSGRSEALGDDIWYAWEEGASEQGWLLSYVDVLSVILAMLLVLLVSSLHRQSTSDVEASTEVETPELVSVAVTDQQVEGLSAIYTFFDPDLDARSLGGWSILQQIELCRQASLPYLYLGYWIRDSRKMRYKIDYRPVELFLDGRWTLLN